MDHPADLRGYCLQGCGTPYGMPGRPSWDCTRHVTGCLEKGPEREEPGGLGSSSGKTAGKQRTAARKQAAHCTCLTMPCVCSPQSVLSSQ